MSSTSSARARENGNEFYRKAGTVGLAPILQHDRYIKALRCYNEASQRASNGDEMASALKNIGNANLKLAQLSTRKLNEKRVTIAHHYQEAIKYLSAAFERSAGCKTLDWRSNIVATLGLCLEESIAWSESLEIYKERLDSLESLGRDLSIPQIAVEFQLKIGKLIFHDGSTKLQNSDYKGCLSRMKDCYFHLEEAKRLGRSANYDDREQEIEVVQQDVYYTTTTAESMQAREHGRQLLDIAIKEEEDLNMDLIWDVVDWYKQSTIFAHELDLEQEAISLSCLGSVYDKVLKLQEKAKMYFMRAVQLAESMKPRTFVTEDWYDECVTTLKRYQDELLQKEENERRESTAGILEELKEEIKELNEHDVSGAELLTFVYTTFPPKDEKWKKPENDKMESWATADNQKMKSLLQKAIILYHPDKVDENAHGKKWKVLSEEITKRLTQRYEWLK